MISENITSIQDDGGVVYQEFIDKTPEEISEINIKVPEKAVLIGSELHLDYIIVHERNSNELKRYKAKKHENIVYVDAPTDAQYLPLWCSDRSALNFNLLSLAVRQAAEQFRLSGGLLKVGSAYLQGACELYDVTKAVSPVWNFGAFVQQITSLTSPAPVEVVKTSSGKADIFGGNAICNNLVIENHYNIVNNVTAWFTYSSIDYIYSNGLKYSYTFTFAASFVGWFLVGTSPDGNVNFNASKVAEYSRELIFYFDRNAKLFGMCNNPTISHITTSGSLYSDDWVIPILRIYRGVCETVNTMEHFVKTEIGGIPVFPENY